MPGKALVVGIDKYIDEGIKSLNFAESDARSIAKLLSRHADAEESPNFQVARLLSSEKPVTRQRLRGAIQELFANCRGQDVAFYFHGHGKVGNGGAYLVTADAVDRDSGIPMQELVGAAADSQAASVVILLDCCHAGDAGNLAWSKVGVESGQWSILGENMTIMAASRPQELAIESAQGGLFTAALVDALKGAAADVFGDITSAAVYALVERRFSLWQQRPGVKSHMTKPLVLRRVTPRLPRPDLRKLVTLFPTADHLFQMVPDHDPVRDINEVSLTPEVPDKVATGRLFKRFRDAALVCASVPNEDFYYVAQRSHTVELTLFGKEYWHLASRGLI